MSKSALREAVWKRMQEAGVAGFPFPPHGRIPNFKGAAACARFLDEIPEWQEASRIKCNPDSPQRALREKALREGKDVYMAVPRLTQEACFLRLRANARAASTIKGAFEHGEPVTPREMGRIDLIVAGSVAVDRSGGRVGKGGGYSDLEFALAREAGLVDERTPVLTSVHPLQVVDGPVPMTAHDVPVDIIVTSEGVLRTSRMHPKPRGILWDHLSEEKLQEMPPVLKLRERARE